MVVFSFFPHFVLVFFVFVFCVLVGYVLEEVFHIPLPAWVQGAPSFVNMHFSVENRDVLQFYGMSGNFIQVSCNFMQFYFLITYTVLHIVRVAARLAVYRRL